MILLKRKSYYNMRCNEDNSVIMLNTNVMRRLKMGHHVNVILIKNLERERQQHHIRKGIIGRGGIRSDVVFSCFSGCPRNLSLTLEP